MALTNQEKLAWLRLYRSENVGPVTFRRLLERFGTAEKALERLPELSRRGGRLLPVEVFAAAQAQKEMEQTAAYGAHLVFEGDDHYPAMLRQTEDAPPLFTALGNSALLTKPCLGVVGARNASLVGRRIAEDFSSKIGQAGYVIASGLAKGIDTAAHTASLTTGTIAVIAGGIDHIYPSENTALYKKIAEQGVIIAESPFGMMPLARHFPRRNRIISGLSLGVLVVEAAMKSGSLITARQAAEQGREVFAVPGSPLDPRAEGTNNLLRDGAHIATSALDVIQVLKSLRVQTLADKTPPAWKTTMTPSDTEASPTVRLRVLECLSPVPVAIDELIRDLAAPAEDVLTVLLELELAGRIERQAGHKVALVR